MADEPIGSSSRTWVLIVALLLVVVIVWMLLSPGDSEPAYEAGVVDESGGELIVTDPEETGVPVNLPETPMTNVPAEQPGAEPPPPAE